MWLKNSFNIFSWIKLISVLLAFYSQIGFTTTPPLSDLAPCNIKEYYETIRYLWRENKNRLHSQILKSKTDPYELYKIQGETVNLLKYAEHCMDHYILDELLALYLKALYSLYNTDKYVYLNHLSEKKFVIKSLDKKYQMWLDTKHLEKRESILSSAQFLFVISQSLRIISAIEPDLRSSTMKVFYEKYFPVIEEHYSRWIFNPQGIFQVRGWGCQIGGEYIDRSMNHLELIARKLNNSLGDENSPSYCNAVTDTDLWIIAGVSNMLVMSQNSSSKIFINKDRYADYLSYLIVSCHLLESRFTEEKLINFDGIEVLGANFDQGRWDDHPSYRYSGIGSEVSDIKDLVNETKNTNVGWDLSHARRFVFVFDSLYRNNQIIDTGFPSKSILVKLTNQLLYKVYNKNFKYPLFSNYWDGTNGWFRVNYLNRIGFGYAPSDKSLAVITGGFGFWSIYNSDIEILFNSLMSMLDSKDKTVRKHVNEHYINHVWKNYHRNNAQISEEDLQLFMKKVYFQLLPSMCFHNQFFDIPEARKIRSLFAI